MSLRVRRIRPGEGPILRDLRLRALADEPTAFGGRIRDERRLTVQEWDANATVSATASERSLFLSEQGGRVTGMAGGWVWGRPHETFLYSMWVEASARRSGASDALIEAVHAWAVARGSSVLALWVTLSNVRAVRLYQRHGFRDAGGRSDMRWDPTIKLARMDRAI